MQTVHMILRRSGTLLIALLLLIAPPVMSFADDTPNNGIAQPSGVGAETYSYNADSGLWENSYYTWNPVTKVTLPKQALEYTYNPTTGKWDTKIWEFHPDVNKYEQVTQSVDTPPSGAIKHGGPAPAPAPSPVPAPAPALAASPNPSPTPSPAQAASPVPQAAASLADPALTQNTSPQSTAVVDLDSSGGLTVNNATDLTVTNNLQSNALSGNALGQNNYTVGDATSGNAAAIANIINMLQSASGLGGSDLTTFVRDIQGDVSGDLLIDPATFAQPASNSETVKKALDVDVNNSQQNTINNNLDLTATTGNATLDNNYRAGNATSGNAEAVANVVNLINSVIAANQSFMGVVNIYGNYTGNILVPTDSLNALLASNGNNSQNTVDQATSAALTQTNTANQTVNNNIDLTAASGNATATDNFRVGDTTSGQATTNLTILNLTNHQVSAANSLLVFVNVLGKWVGVIMDAPAGATAAALTGGANGSSQAYTAATDLNANITNTENSTINNNITAHAQSGDAALTDNYTAGNARSGDAHASANITNILNSAFSLSHWFGVLFINVFGSWIGNFGTQQPAPAVAGGEGQGGTQSSEPAAVFAFVPTGASGAGSTGSGLSPVSRDSFGSDEQFEQFNQQVATVLAAHDITPKNNFKHPASSATVNNTGFSLAYLPIAIGLAGLTAVGAEKIHSIRKRYVH